MIGKAKGSFLLGVEELREVMGRVFKGVTSVPPRSGDRAAL
ncbi:MAG: hypothetical protein ACYTFA_07380 [Planctomycetota bacterium]